MTHKAQRDNWRVFCAVELPEAVRQRVIDHIALLKEAVPDAHASWGREGSMHLTLKFLGDIPQASVQNLSEAASRAAAGLAPFTICLERTGVFPPHGSPRVLWIGVSDLEGKLGELQASLEEESEKAGFLRESRAFHPHITLARLRQPQHARSLASAHKAMEFEPAEITVSELLAIRSELRSEGSKYTTISRHRLGQL
ncbi:MAG: RNA 2',3'-cyclic phosphodiesterase [Pyrinomonadaceae bacterium]